MNKKTTYDLCTNFGHNFYREKNADHPSDVVKCKHCQIEVTMNSNGDFEELEESNLAIHKVMKKLFLLRSSKFISTRRQIFSI